MPDDQELSRRYRAAANAVGTGHLDEATWVHLATDGLSASERERALSHVLRCASCADVYRGVAQLRAESVAFDPAAPRAPRARLTLVRASAAVALAVAALLAFVVLRPIFSDRTDLTLRSDSAKARPVPIAPLGKLSVAPAGFSFEPMVGAKIHRVQLLNADGAELWTSANLSSPKVEWPKAVKPAPGRYYWQVLGFPAGPASEGVASTMVDFELTSSPP